MGTSRAGHDLTVPFIAWSGGERIARGLAKAHLSGGKSVTKMGHPVLWLDLRSGPPADMAFSVLLKDDGTESLLAEQVKLHNLEKAMVQRAVPGRS